ncbi:hypothetical protein TNCV_4552321 [Trichonephila clavipes]|nr:hypothetical protein TNCV_4552321 [Trichonephila clavipes]
MESRFSQLELLVSTVCDSFSQWETSSPTNRESPLPPQIAFFLCPSQSQDESKARLPIGRDSPSQWSIELLCMIFGRLDGPDDLAIQYIFIITLKLTRASKESHRYSPSALIGDEDLFRYQELRWKPQLQRCHKVFTQLGK